MTEVLFIGVDGGGTRCRARIANIKGEALGEGLAGSGNTRLGLAQVFGEILAACQQALVAAGLRDSDIGRLHAGLGLAGLALQSERDNVLAHHHPFASMVVDTDAYIACLGAHAGADGAILILGTGSCGCGIVQGRTFTVGGWGFQLGDQGSGAAIGRSAVRRALWAFEGLSPPTPLSEAIMARFKDSPEQAVLWADQAKPRDYAALAPLVFEHAASGDPLAQALIFEEAAKAAQLIRALLTRGAPAVAVLGGLAQPITSYLPSEVQAALTPPKADALAGALLMARQHYQTTTAPPR